MANRHLLQPFLSSAARAVVLDGGMGTALADGQAQKHVMWGTQLLLEQEGKDEIRNVHTNFLKAGADIICSNSYKVSLNQLQVTGLFNHQSLSEQQAMAASMLETAVNLAKEARDAYILSPDVKRPAPLVAASIGPVGDSAKTFTGATDPNTMTAAEAFTDDFVAEYYRHKLQGLMNAGPDLIAFETLPSVHEADIALTVLKELDSSMPAWVSFICASDTSLSSGDEWVSSVSFVDAHTNVIAVGLNCTAPHLVPALLRSASSVASKPLLAYPNSGEVWDAREGHRAWSDSGSMKWLDGSDALEMYDCGARLIGGCCNVRYDQIALFREALDRRS